MEENIRRILRFAVGIMAIVIVIMLFNTPRNKKTTEEKRNEQINTTENDNTTSTSENNVNDSYTTSTEESKLIITDGLDGDYFEGEITIPRTLVVEDGKTISIIEPIALTNHEASDSEERARLKEEALQSTGIRVLEAYGNDDGSISLVFDAENMELYIKEMEKLFNNSIKNLYNKVSINKEFNRLIIYIDENTEPFEYGKDIICIAGWMVSAQIYTGVPYEEWYVNVTTVYEETGEVMLEFPFYNDGGTFTITDEDWEEMFEQVK